MDPEGEGKVDRRHRTGYRVVIRRMGSSAGVT
jgi:hypothetical protein